MPGWCGMVRRDEAVGMATVSEVSLPPLPREKPVVWKRSLGYRGSTGWPLVRNVWVTPVSQFKLALKWFRIKQTKLRHHINDKQKCTDYSQLTCLSIPESFTIWGDDIKCYSKKNESVKGGRWGAQVTNRGNGVTEALRDRHMLTFCLGAALNDETHWWRLEFVVGLLRSLKPSSYRPWQQSR